MKVSTTAGDFEIRLEDAKVQGEFIVLNGKMGVWDSKTYLGAEDLWLFTRILMKPPVLLFLLKMPFKSLLKRKKIDES